MPEICKKSLNSCPADGGLELFIIGKNFLKDTYVIFQETYDTNNVNDELNASAGAADITNIRQQMIGAFWEQTVVPDKEYLQQVRKDFLHLIETLNFIIQFSILVIMPTDSFDLHSSSVYTSEYHETGQCTSACRFERQKK